MSAAAAMPVVVTLAVASTPARRAVGVAGCLAGPHVGCLAGGGGAGGVAAALADNRAHAFFYNFITDLLCLAEHAAVIRAAGVSRGSPTEGAGPLMQPRLLRKYKVYAATSRCPYLCE